MDKEKKKKYDMEYHKTEKYKDYQKRYYLKNKRKINKKHKENYYKNIEYRKRKAREYSKQNREKILKYQKEWYLKNRERELISRRLYQKKNRVRINGYHRSLKVRKQTNIYRKKRRKIDRNYNIQIRLSSNFRHALRKYTKTGKVMPSKKYGVDYKAIIEHYEKNKPIPMDLSNYVNHHIKPLFTFNFVNPDGSTNLEEVKKAWRPKNLMLVTKEEHREIHRKLKN